MSEGTLLESEEHYEEPLPPHDEEDSQVGSSEMNVAMNGDSEQSVKPDTTTAQVLFPAISPIYSQVSFLNMLEIFSYQVLLEHQLFCL